MHIVLTEDLNKNYGLGDTIVKALDHVNITVDKGEFVSVVGTSGSGKSTLLHMLGGLDVPTSGSVTIDGKSLEKLSRDELTIYRRKKIGFVFQNYNLLPLLNVYENIVLPIQLDGKKPDDTYIEQLMEVLGLKEKKFFMPNMLSGGQQQRVSLARALATKPAIILADEPTGNLDSQTTNNVIDLMIKTSKQFDQTIIMITHDEELAKRTDRTIRIEDGKIC